MPAPVEYRELPLPARWRDVARCAWLLEGEAPGRVSIAPDGCPELVVHLGAPFRRWEAGRSRPQPRLLAVGALDRSLTIEPTGRARMVGLRLRPDAARRVLGVSARELANRDEDLALAWEPLAEELGQRLAAAPADAACVAVLDDVLDRATRRAGAGTRDARVAAAVDAIERTGGRVRIGALAAGLGLSTRTLERRFLEHVGVPPKRLARIARFQSALGRVLAAGGAPDWADVAHACGFVDQPHLAREVRAITGATATELASPEQAWNGLFAGVANVQDAGPRVDAC